MSSKILLCSALLALAPVASAAGGAIPVRPPGTGTYLPHGDIVGAWSSASLVQDGLLNAVVSDAAGQPLWVLDAKLSLHNTLQGSLIPMEYAGNPVEVLGVLAVQGSYLLGEQGRGVFDAVMYQPQLPGMLVKPIFALGFLQGELIDDRVGGTQKLAAFSASKTAARGLATNGHQPGGVIFDPKGPDVALAGVSSAGQLGLVGQGASVPQAKSAGAAAGAGFVPDGVILDPKGPDVAIQSIGSAGAHAAAGQAAGAAPLTQAGGSYSQAGHGMPAIRSGKAFGRWFFAF